MVQTLVLRATQDDVIWPRRPLVSSKGLLSCVQNLPLSSYDKRPTTFRAVAFNVSGELLAATDERGHIFVFFVTANRYSLVQHLGVPTISCCFSPRRKTELLVTCEDETVRCIDVQSQTLISTLRGHRLPARCASFQKSGQLALTASQDAVILWDTKDWSRYRVLNAGPGVEEAIFVTKGNLVAVCFQDDTIMMWELESLALRYRFSLPEKEQSPGLQKIAVSDDHQVLVASGRAPFIYVWEFESQTIIRIIELPPPIKQVVSHAFLPGHNSMLSILADDGGVFFLDVAAKSPQIKLEISNRGRTATAFDIECHARYLAASTSDGFLLLYDMEITRETAARAQERRRKEGLLELGDHARLRTRSGLEDVALFDVDPAADSNQVELNASEQSRPVASKLIDSLFGAKYPRHGGRTPRQTRVDTTAAGQPGTPRTRPASATRARVRATGGSFTVPSKDVKDSECLTLRERVRTRRTNPLTRPFAQLSAQEIEVNRKRLVGSLKVSGMFPRKYRVLVWRFLLRLPKNEEAFRSLVAKGKHPVFVRLKDHYPLQDGRLFRRLHRLLSAIVYWCPAFGEVSYLPAVVYPFVKIFRENDLAAFEASISVLLHWCGDFLISLPYPPVFALRAIEHELARRDSQLFDHFTRYQITSEAFAWSLLKTIFTEVLSEDEWMCLWDHLFAFSDTPQLIYVAVLAYLSYFRTALLAACDRFSIEQFFHQQNAIDIQKFVQLMMNLREKLDLSEFSAIEDPAAAGSTTSAHRPYWPLSRGQYPAFAHYPRFVVDFQISERNRIALEEAELARKQSLFDQIEQDSAKLKAEHEKWMKERKIVLEAEERRRKEAIAAEKERILHLKTLDYQTRKRRLQHLSNMEKSASESLEEASKMLQTEYQRMESALAMQKERMEFEISSRKQEEDLQRVEVETHDRVRGIHKQREMEERLSRLRTEFETRLKQQELQYLLKFESWKREDEEQTRNARAKLRQREESALLSQEKRVRQELENKLLEQQLAKDREVLELETARRARRKERQEHDTLDDEISFKADEEFFSRGASHQANARVHGKEDRDSRTERSHQEYVGVDGQRDRGNARRSLDESSASASEVPSWRPPTGDIADNASEGDEPPPCTPDYRSSQFATRSPLQGPLSSESSMSFASASMRRTMAEMSLLEKALGNVSSSHSDDENVESHAREEDRSRQNMEESLDLETARYNTPQPSSRQVARESPQGESEAIQTQNFSHKHVHEEEILTPPTARKLLQPQAEGVTTPLASWKVSLESNEAEFNSPATLDLLQVHEDGYSTPRRAQHFSQVQEEVFTPLAARNDSVKSDNVSTSEGATREYSQTQERVYNPVSIAESVASTANQHAESAADLNVNSESDSDASMNVMDALQRPIAELEKKLGIRFDDFSDEEKEDENLDESFDVRYESDEEDETIEDDRTKLLQRAKRLLELSSFDTDSDEDL
ncbi:Rab-GTPase-TBC domain [Phytophthora infestans]|uniref:TBC1 domain family member 31 n=1 Tax=Phytophthora infestans TaxID=4787 RepID=A0A833SDS8_PHYIN|nr:Rab-GTPase-TBC domain [Phytophthora infestans]KAF4137256.1 Rab-GTPase-TBC domain [Phytophthora infestans]